jgi:Ankyrin repeats (3 copies)
MNNHNVFAKRYIPKKSTRLIKAVKEGNMTKVIQLLNDKVDIDKKDGHGCTALIVAAKEGKSMIIRILLKRGAKMDLKDKTGRTAGMWASQKGHVQVVDILQKHRNLVAQKIINNTRKSSLLITYLSKKFGSEYDALASKPGFTEKILSVPADSTSYFKQIGKKKLRIFLDSANINKATHLIKGELEAYRVKQSEATKKYKGAKRPRVSTPPPFAPSMVTLENWQNIPDNSPKRSASVVSTHSPLPNFAPNVGAWISPKRSPKNIYPLAYGFKRQPYASIVNKVVQGKVKHYTLNAYEDNLEGIFGRQGIPQLIPHDKEAALKNLLKRRGVKLSKK